MMHPLQKYGAGTVAILPPRLFPSPAYFALMARYPRVVVDDSMRYDKRRKEVHRFTIADPRGPVALTVPVSRPAGAFREGNLCWCDVTVSAHGRWWETIPSTLATVYGRSPFFEYYIDRLMPVFAEPSGQPITQLDSLASSIVRKILGLSTEVLSELPSDALEVHDFRRLPIALTVPAYWQIHPIEEPLSVLDLIFNVGPEAPLFLTDATSGGN